MDLYETSMALYEQNLTEKEEENMMKVVLTISKELIEKIAEEEGTEMKGLVSLVVNPLPGLSGQIDIPNYDYGEFAYIKDGVLSLFSSEGRAEVFVDENNMVIVRTNMESEDLLNMFL